MQDLIKDLLTLYKLIVLYMLSCVDFPLTKAQIGDFILEKEYTDFLTLQQTFNELIDAGLITAKSIRNRTHLSITEEGTETLNFFRGKLNEGIRSMLTAFSASIRLPCGMRHPFWQITAKMHPANTMPD